MLCTALQEGISIQTELSVKQNLYNFLIKYAMKQLEQGISKERIIKNIDNAIFNTTYSNVVVFEGGKAIESFEMIDLRNEIVEEMLKIENLCKSFRTEDVETIALNNVSFTVEDGEFVAIMGPSGCGKSTLLNILGLLDNPTSGKYFLGNHEVADLKENERTDVRKGEIGFVFQSFNLIDELTVEENIELPLTYLNIPKAECKAKVQAIMKRMAISHRAKHFPHQLSGGQQQRVAIARAVVFGPKLILADEPTGNLDSKNGAEVMHLLTELNHEGTTIVMVTHNEHDAKIAHRIIRLFDGSIVDTANNKI